MELPLKIDDELKSLLYKLIDKKGIERQTTVAIEELSELQKELCKHRRDKYNEEHMAEEMAHVILMVSQLLVLFDNKDLVQKYYDEALERVYNIIN